MTELRLRDASYKNENAEMNALLLAAATGGRVRKETIPPVAGYGRAVPPGAGPAPRENENEKMNRLLLAALGGAPIGER